MKIFNLNFLAPDKWSAAGMYQATKIFTSNWNTSMLQKFIKLVLLPRIRDDISYYKRLNYHLFQAMAKLIFKPEAFFKGILFPLCEVSKSLQYFLQNIKTIF